MSVDFKHFDELLSPPPYGVAPEEKSSRLSLAMKEVTQFHFENCAPYKKLCTVRNFDPYGEYGLEDIPYLPTSLFKDILLISVPQDKVFREISSSATTSGRPSRVGLDRETSRRQSKCFNKVTVDRLGAERRKFVVLDEPSTLERTSSVSARASTIRSLLFCSSAAVACMAMDKNNDLSVDMEILDTQLREAEATGEPLVIFGFTFILYVHVLQQLKKLGRTYKLSNAKIVHIGGWKKLEAQSVTPEVLAQMCSEVFSVKPSDVIDFYGFTEQSGMIYPTCEKGYRHMPTWGEVIVRDPMSMAVLPAGESGLLQFITPIETSYPGHSILTEDLGMIVSKSDCGCGRHGTAFKVIGRAPNSEVRGCGDIMAEKFA